MPIRVLERLGGNQFMLRKKALVPGGLNFSGFITFLGLMSEVILLVGEISFVLIMIQMFFPSALSSIRDNLETIEIFIFAAFCFNFILTESLYVCMGFGLYVNCRVEVEGWDLQILFQKFSGPASGEKAPVPAAKAILIACFFLALLLSPASPALHAGQGEASPAAEEVLARSGNSNAGTGYEDINEEEFAEAVEYYPADFPFVPDESLGKLNEILASEDFGAEREGWGIRFKELDNPMEIPEIELAPWMEKMRQMFSFMLRFIVILAIAAFVGFALFWFLKTQGNLFRLKGLFGSQKKGKSYTNPLLSSESPELLFDRAEDLFFRSRLREAWAACLSACIGAFASYHSLSFPDDATEYGCLDLVRRTLPNKEEGFVDLVQSWILFAYGGRIPAEGAFEKALAYGRSIKEPRLGESDEP